MLFLPAWVYFLLEDSLCYKKDVILRLADQRGLDNPLIHSHGSDSDYNRLNPLFIPAMTNLCTCQALHLHCKLSAGIFHKWNHSSKLCDLQWPSGVWCDWRECFGCLHVLMFKWCTRSICVAEWMRFTEWFFSKQALLFIFCHVILNLLAWC